MKILIENHYIDGHQCEQTIELPEPTLAELLHDPYGWGSDWWQDKVHPFTGCGHGLPEVHGGARTMPATYVATVVAADDPALLDRTYEWSG